MTHDQVVDLFDEIRRKSSIEKLRLRISKDREIKEYESGKVGEEAVSKVLKASFPNMRIVDDSYYDISSIKDSISGYDATMQIDHIMVSDHCVYVIETKRYSENAWISGSSDSKCWNYGDDSVKKTSVTNADKQNQGHVDYLRRVCGLNESINVISIVCLAGIDEKNVKISMKYKHYIFTIDELPYMIEALERRYEKQSIQRDATYNSIYKNRLDSFDMEVNHIIYVKLLKKAIRETGKKRRKPRKSFSKA